MYTRLDRRAIYDFGFITYTPYVYVPLIAMQDGTTADTFTPGEYMRALGMLLRKGTEESTRDLAMMAVLFSSMGRSDDARLMYICDMVQPTLLHCVGKLLA